MAIPRFDFDLLVIGGGSGGVRAARTAAAAGVRVGLAEHSALGGTCVNVGCIPKKLYSFAAGYASAFKEAGGYGWKLPEVHEALDWNHLKAGRAKEIARLNGVYHDLLLRSGVVLLPGHAVFEGAHAVVVDGRRYTAERVLIATGGTPRTPTIAGHQYAIISDAMFDLDRLPDRLVVVGGGYIACELASIFSGLGSNVTLVHRRQHLLSDFDQETAHFLERELAASGVDIRTGTEVKALERSSEEGRLSATLSDGSTIDAATVLYAIGRIPRTEGLGLESAGVKLDAVGAIVVDRYYCTSAPSIYAVGDVSSRKQLTPVATAEAMAVVDRLYGDGVRRVNYEFIPTAIFTHPQLASCGYSECEANDRFGPENVLVYSSDFKALRHSMSGRKDRTFVKLIVNRLDDRVVGLHMVGDEAGEIVQGFAVAMNAGAKKAHFDATIGVHPTVAEEFVTLRVPKKP